MPMSAVSLETPNDVRARLSHALENSPVVSDDIEPWELHSELVLVSPEVCTRALEELPERDPDAFLSRPPSVANRSASEQEAAPLPAQPLLGYTLWRFGETARVGLLIVGSVVAVTCLIELLH
jgi:hypothetical protein